MSHCYNYHEVKTCWKCIHLFKLLSTNRLYERYVKQWLAHFSRHWMYISSTFNNISSLTNIFNLLIAPFVFCCSPLKQCLFLLWYAYFENQNITIFASFFISMLRIAFEWPYASNLFFAFKNKNYRVYHEFAFEFTDWLIWLNHQFRLAHLINISWLKYF